MYRSRTVQNLPKEIFDVFTVDWMFNMACGDQGPIGFMPQPMSVYRKHRTGTWTGKAELDQIDTVLSLIDRYDQLLGGTYKAQFEKRKAHLTAFKKRLAKTPELEVLGEDGRKFDSPPSTLNPLNQTYLVDLVVLDTVFPHPLSPFRNQEFINYLDHFPSSLVLTTGEHLPAFKEKRDIVEIINTFEQEHAEYAGRTIPSDHNLERYTARLAYAIFLDNIWSFLDAIEEKKIPFVFTLYPGGGFKLNIPECDAKLIRVFGSSQFRKVIVTQKVTYDYLLEKNFCPPEKIEFLYGVVTPLTILRDFNHKIWYGGEKQRLDICFVAHKYMEGGIDKGYDLFIEAAKKLAAEITNIHFHVVGNFDEADYPIDGLVGRLTFYGQRHQDWFDEFYRDKDIILSPNKPFTLLPGTFDGFPTASCTEAGLRKVAIFCTDILMLNMKFTDRKDIVIIQPDVLDIVETIMYYYENPAELRAVAENGFRRIRTVYNFENQISPRIQIIEQELQNKA
jgi:glycosyltransferase involved in cell wall biosynthesis